jgi:hypothetical protein
MAALSSSACPKLKNVATVLTSHHPSKKPLSRVPSIRALVCLSLFLLVSAKFTCKKCKVTWKKYKVTHDVKTVDFHRIMTYLRLNEMVAMLDCNSPGRIGFLDSNGFWYHAPKDFLILKVKVLAVRAIRIAAEAEAARIAAEAEATRISTEAEAARIAAEAEADRIAAEAVAKADGIAVEAKSNSAHHPVKQSAECIHAERKWYEF